jgi:hypothetical protein
MAGLLLNNAAHDAGQRVAVQALKVFERVRCERRAENGLNFPRARIVQGREFDVCADLRSARFYPRDSAFLASAESALTVQHW